MAKQPARRPSTLAYTCCFKDCAKVCGKPCQAPADSDLAALHLCREHFDVRYAKGLEAQQDALAKEAAGG